MDFIRNHQLDIMLSLSSICFIILIFVLMTNYLSKEKKKSLIIISFSAAFLLLSDRYAYIFRGQTTSLAYFLAPLFKYLVFFNILNVSYGFNEFFISIYKENHNGSLKPKIFNYIKTIVIIGHIFLIISQFTNLYYSFDEFNNYHRESGYALCYFFPILATIIQYIVIIKDYIKVNKRIFVPIVLYFILPIITTIIQLFISGVSLTNITIGGIVILLYSFTIYDANKILKEKEKTEADLRLANEIQQNEIPNEFPAFPNRNEFDLYAMMSPAKEVGGDFYDYFLLDENHLGLVMADVSGKGVPAALNMVKTKLLLKGTGLYINNPAKVLELLNDGFIDNNKLEIFVTVWFGILEISTGKLKFANAGHEDLIIYNKSNGFNLYKTKHGLPIGVMKNYKYNNNEIILTKKDKIFLYTDGVVDTMNKDNKQYGIDRLLRTLNMNKNKKSKDIINAINEDLKNYSGDCKPFDDITMLCFVLNDKQEENNKLHLNKKFKADVKEINHIFEYFTNILNKAVGEENIKNYYIVIDEIFSNIAKYAYKNITDDREKYVSIDLTIDLEKKKIKMIFEDDGVPFNPLTIMDPNTNKSASEREVGGLGIYIVKKMMDKVDYKYKNNKNVLIIEKKY